MSRLRRLVAGISVVMLGVSVHAMGQGMGLSPSWAATQTLCPAPTPEEIAASPPGDNPNTWICEATSKQPISGALHWMRGSAEYRGLARATFTAATHAAERAARKYGRWGFIVILAVDDTLLSSTGYQKEREICGLPYSEASWCRWVNAQVAPAVPGAREFTERVHRLGGLIGIVTNRASAQEWITRKNLSSAGIFYDAFRPKLKNSSMAPRWKSIRGELAEVARKLGRKGKPPVPVIFIGAQMSDLPLLDAKGNIIRARDEKDDGQGLGDNLFLMPNPEYGEWQNDIPE